MSQVYERVKSSFLQHSVKSSLYLENMHVPFLMKIFRSIKFLGPPFFLNASTAGNGS